jgi:hypothetical protein
MDGDFEVVLKKEKLGRGVGVELFIVWNLPVGLNEL